MRRAAALLLAGLALAGPGIAPGAAGLQEVRQLLEAGETEAARAAALTLARDGDRRAQETLASMLLRGIGGPADRERGMAWLCVRVHDPAGGHGVGQALWLLAEYFRTGGGLPGRRWNEGDRSREDPVKAYFWFRAMAGQADHYREVDADAERLGRIGAADVARQLLEGERQLVDRRLESWSPARAPASPERCLDLPRA